MRLLLVFLFLLAVAVAQTTAGAAWRVLGVMPNAVLVLVVCWGLLRGGEEGMLWGLAGGLAIGLLSGAPLGAHALMLTLVGLLAGVSGASPLQSRLVIPLLTISSATVVYTAGMAVILRLLGRPFVGLPGLTRIVVPAILVNGVLMLFCYWLMAFILERRGVVRSEF